MTVPGYLPYYVLGSSTVILAALLFGLHRALAVVDWPDSKRKSVFYAIAGILLGWFAVAVSLAVLEAFGAASDRLPTIQYAIAVPILLGALAIWRSPTLSRLIDAVPQAWVVGIQAYRVLGIIFVVLYAAHEMPAVFAWPAGVGDVLVGVLAPFVAWTAAHRPQARFSAVLLWNVLGIADLTVAIGTGFLSSPSPLQRLAFDQPNELITAYPLVLIPAFLVPLSILLHLVSLAKLARARGPVGARLQPGRPGAPLAE